MLFKKWRSMLFFSFLRSHMSRNTYWMMKLMATVIVCYFLYSVLITMHSLRCPRWGVWFHLAVWGTALLWSAYIAVCIVAMFHGPELFYTIMSYIALVTFHFEEKESNTVRYFTIFYSPYLFTCLSLTILIIGEIWRSNIFSLHEIIIS